MSHRSRNTATRLIVGLAVIAVGALFAADNLDLLDADDLLIYWPSVLILIGLVRLPGAKRQEALLAWILILGGLWVLLYNLEYTDFEPWLLFWPVILVLVGANLILGALRRNESRADSNDWVNQFSFWSGAERTFDSPNFQGGDLTAIMGGWEIDLTHARMAEKTATMQVFAFWGGGVVRVPKEWRVQFEVFPLLGGASDKTQFAGGSAAPTLLIKGMAIMGGFEVKN
jgi:hypothetical protein